MYFVVDYHGYAPNKSSRTGFYRQLNQRARKPLIVRRKTCKIELNPGKEIYVFEFLASAVATFLFAYFQNGCRCIKAKQNVAYFSKYCFDFDDVDIKLYVFWAAEAMTINTHIESVEH